MRSKIAYMLFLLLPLAGMANGLEELRKMNKAYLQATSFSMQVSVQAFRKIKDAKPLYEYAGKVEKSGDNYLTEMNGRVTLNNSDYTLLADDYNKVIIVAKAAKRKKSNGLEQFIMTDSLFEGDFNYKIVSEAGGKKVIEVKAKEPACWENNKMEITLNAATSVIEQLVIYPKAGADTEEEYAAEKIVVKYTNIKLNAAIAEAGFSEKRFIVFRKNEIVPSEKFKTYKIIDQRKK